jgi:predicted house-cleaning noncanonical NTP pyrophosphatase (MazG superfamily)
MGWKIVRDKNEAWCRAHGLSGQWRRSPNPIGALAKKIGEEYGEYVGDGDAGELYDLLDVVERLIGLRDPDGAVALEHKRKVAELGAFDDLIEWTPVPPSDTASGAWE